MALYAALVNPAAPASVPRVVAFDADDGHVIAAAVAGGAELNDSGDRKHLLPIGSPRAIAIVTGRGGVELLKARGNT